MTSPVSELLVQETLCTDLFKTISESVESSRHNDAEETSVSGQDDVIGKLLDRMIQILPPEERNVFGTTEDKKIEEIIEEANELIRATTPLFSSTDSGERSWNKTSKALSKVSKTSELSSKHDHLEQVIAPKKSESGTSSICSSMDSIIVKDILSHDLSDKGRSPQVQESGSFEKLDEDIIEIFPKKDKSNTNLFEKHIERTEEMESSHRNQDSIKKANDESNEKIRNLSCTKPNEQDLPKTNINIIQLEVDSEDKTQAELEKRSETPHYTLSSDNKGPETQLEAVQEKYAAEIKELKLMHNKEIYGLTKQITSLNDKIFELQKHSKIKQSPDLKIQEIERLENEIKCQEQLLDGYERENKKLCKEISNLKEGWKLRENKLVEEKQRLQNELQGMVSKTTTDALQEQLKDARETIVKLQMEVTSYKSKNKELEMTCDRLRVETQSLQRELSNCRCDRVPVGRRDKYSLLASSNVGSQIMELKNVIARKDMEIAQMNTTLRILKGELSNREVMPLSPGGMLEEQSQQLELTVSQLQTSLAVERQNYRDLAKEKDGLLKENLDLKRQVRELESIIKRRQRSDSCFPVAPEPQTTLRLAQLEKELSSRQEALTTLHSQFINMQKKYEDHIEEVENRLKESRDEVQAMKISMKKEEANQKISARKTKVTQAVVKEETHLLATIRGLRQEVATKEKDMNKLNKEMEELRQTNRKLQKEREKQLNSLPSKMSLLREKPNLKKTNPISGSRHSITSPNNNIDPILFAELQESNLILKSKTKGLQEEVKRLEQDLIAMHNKRVHDIN